MKKTINCLSFCLVFLLFACQSTPTEPVATASLQRTAVPQKDSLQTNKQFVSASGRFSINFPGTPQLHQHKTEIEIGTIQLYQYIYSEDNLRAWLVSYSDYPSKMIEVGSTKQLLKGIKHRFMKGLKASPSTESTFSYEDKYPGYSFVGHSKSNQLDVVYRTFLVENRVFQISMYSSVGPISSADSTAFVGSFELLNAKDSL